ncbi:hypothetical protein ACFQDN_19955 [Pseudomonas asuensis]|nr:hypothetical protein [Pseudomonas asuensis]
MAPYDLCRDLSPSIRDVARAKGTGAFRLSRASSNASALGFVTLRIDIL